MFIMSYPYLGCKVSDFCEFNIRGTTHNYNVQTYMVFLLAKIWFAYTKYLCYRQKRNDEKNKI